MNPSEESADLVSQTDDSLNIPLKTCTVGSKVIIGSDSVIDIFRRTPWYTYLFFILMAVIMSTSISIDFSF